MSTVRGTSQAPVRTDTFARSESSAEVEQLLRSRFPRPRSRSSSTGSASLHSSMNWPALGLDANGRHALSNIR